MTGRRGAKPVTWAAGLTVREDSRGEPYVTFSVRVTGERQLALLAALCLVERCKPPAIAAPLVRAHLDAEDHGPLAELADGDVRRRRERAAEAEARWRGGLRVVE